MSKVLQERGFGSLTRLTEANQEIKFNRFQLQIKQIHNQYAILDSSQYAVSTIKNYTLIYETKQTTIPFLSRLNGYYCEEKKGSYGPQFSKAYSEASQSIPRKEKDLGRASVSVMPLSTYLNLGLGELAHTKLTVELADMTVKYPKGIAENILVGIGKFTFPVDFIILDMPEDIKVFLILGRPFLSTAHDKIDVYKRKDT
ncbi:hypothetical protein Tco_0393784 [Tanacetum coccineum]